MLQSLDSVAAARVEPGVVQLVGQGLIENFIDQRGLAGAGHTGDAGEGSQGDFHVDPLQIVLPGAPDGDGLSAARPAAGGNGNPFGPGQILSRDAPGTGHDILQGAGRHNLSAVDTGPGTYVYDVVGGPHGVLVVLHHQQGVAQIPQALEGGDELVVVPLVQADGGLVQNIQHPHQGGADLCGQPDPLALAAGQRGGGPAEGQIPQSHGLQKAQPVPDLLQDAVGNEHLLVRQLQAVDHVQLVHHGQLREGVDVHVPHRHRQGLLPQAAALAGGAGAVGHGLLQFPLGGVALGLQIPPLQIVADALKGLIQHALAPGLVIFQLQLLVSGAVEDDVPHLLRQLLPGRGQREVIFLGQGIEVHPGDAVAADIVPAAGLDGPLQNGQILVRDHQIRVHFLLEAQARAGGAGAEGIVEGEHPWRQLLDGDTAVLAGIVLGEHQILLLPQEVHHHDAPRQGGGRLHAVRQPLADVGPDDEPVHDDLDAVLFVLLQLDLLVQLIEGAVHPDTDIAGLPGVLEDLGVLALLPPDYRGHDLNAGALRQGQHLVDDLVDGLLADLFAALGTVGRAHSGPQQTEVVVDLRHRAHSGARVLAGGLLVDGDGRREAVDIVHVRLVHLSQEHPGIGGQGLHIPPLPLGVDGIEGQGGLAGPAESRQHHQLVPRDGDVDVFQVVGSGAFDDDFVLHGCCFLLFRSA